MILTPDALADVLEEYTLRDIPPLPGRRNHLLAPVLLPLLWRDGPVAIATLRAPDLSQHAGEVCFPGGRREEGDADMFATACREAREEVGIEGVRRLGQLSSFPLYTSDYRLVPFVAQVSDEPLQANPKEVAEILHVPLGEVLTQDSIDAIPWEHQGRTLLSPVFTLGPHVMYGGTAHTFFELLEVVARAADIPLPPLEPGRYQWSELLG